jgi:hypothetical protein
MKAKQARMFQTEDLPLFSGTTPRGTIPTSTHAEPAQPILGGCRLCLDTGLVDGKPCWCEAGAAYTLSRRQPALTNPGPCGTVKRQGDRP